MNPQESTPARHSQPRGQLLFGLTMLASAAATIVVLALLVNIMTRKQEAQTPYQRVVEVTEDTVDPAAWGANWPHQYDSYRRTVDYERTRYGGSDAVPKQKLDADPWLRTMWSGYAFALDYREARGHAYMLWDQDHTERVLQRPQPGACLHCHASILPAYRQAGQGDLMVGFRKVNAMTWNEARQLTDDAGQPLVTHPVSCVDCHDPKSMRLRVTRPAFIEGIRRLKAHAGVPDYDVNRDATRHEMRTFACAQCHVEYYFAKPEPQLTYPWHKGIRVEEIESHYDEIDFHDWKHGITGAATLKAQHPEFELWSQGIHARAGVACADCHMPYRRVGAMKVTDHHVRSPLLDVAASCQVCHRIAESELLERAHTTQDRTQALIDRAAEALTDMIDGIAQAQKSGAAEEKLEAMRRLHRRAQWRLDFVYSENSRGFHAPQESARILAESIDFARQASALAAAANGQANSPRAAPHPVEGVTPGEQAPPGPPTKK